MGKDRAAAPPPVLIDAMTDPGLQKTNTSAKRSDGDATLRKMGEIADQ